MVQYSIPAALEGRIMKKLLSTAAVLGGLYLAFVWLTETELFSTDIRFKIHSEFSETLGGRR
jgi:hypothetical protein